MARKVFYSFHYQNDAWRTAQVRNIGVVDGSKPVSDNDWETVKRGGDSAIRKWIDSQINGTSCCIVLVGEETSKRPWVKYEIERAWNAGKGVAGIHINQLLDSSGNPSKKGENPFDFMHFDVSRKPLSSAVKCYTPSGSNSREVYSWIEKNISIIVEDAIKIRGCP